VQGNVQYESVRTLARRLSVHPETVRRWVRDDSIPFIRIGGVVRFDTAEVDQWAASHGNATGRGVAS